MPLTVGSRLGVYEVTAAIGAGGMGEVFRARDTRLNRDVAIKVLPDDFADDAERRARFEREAQVLASLNHPHIAHVYGIEEGTGGDGGAAGTSRHAPRYCALVMEFVDGQDLAARIAQGPIPADEAIAIAIQVAHALEAAHDQGVVHRDLKPANIRLRRNGTVKVLDFGLAKLGLGTGAPGATGAITSPAMTMGGVVLGTAAYMSPEQARGRPVDRRSDIWAFGVVLYEMLTGRTMFAADTVSDTIAAVLTREPALDLLPPQTPATAKRVLERCLQKDPARRLHHIADARLELEQAANEPATIGGTAAPAARTPWWPTLALALASALVAAAVVGTMLSGRGETPPLRYSLLVPDAGFNTVSFSAISPDGKWIAYSPNQHAGPFRLLLRPLDGFETREIMASPDTGYNPFFSDDGQWLAYKAGNTLFRVPVSGGTPERLGPVLPGSADGDWGDDGGIVLAAHFRLSDGIRKTLIRLAQDGQYEVITPTAPGEAHHDVEILPGSEHVLFTISTPQSAVIAVTPIAGGPPRVLLQDARRPRYAAGRLLFQRVSSGDLVSVAFDPERVAITGEPGRLASVAFVGESAAFDASRDGTIIFSTPDDTTAQDGFTAVLVDRSGKETTVLAQLGSWSEPRVSPDGRSVVLRDVVSPNCHLWSIDLARGTRTRVTFEGDNHSPVWRADGQLTWGSASAGARTIVMGRADRPSSIAALGRGENDRLPESWSRDGTLLAFTEYHPERSQDIWLLSASSGDARPFANTMFNENQPRFSPDGQWLAYVSDDSGRGEVYLQPVDGAGARLQVSVDGGHSPLWSADGNELFYVERASLMQVAIDRRPSRPEISRPRKLLEGRYVWERTGNFDITPDGQRFVFIRRTAETDPSATLRVLIHWLAAR